MASSSSASSSSSSSVDRGGIVTAAYNGDLRLVKVIVRAFFRKFGEETSKEMLGTKDMTGRTVLHHAAAKGRTNVCSYLVHTLKIDVNVKDYKGYTPLHSSVFEGHYMTTSFLLDNGANPNLGNEDALSPLHCAASKGRKDLLRLLISKGAEVDASSSWKGTPLRCAAAYGRKDAIKVLLEHKADPNSSNSAILAPLNVAILSKSIDCVRLLLKGGANPNVGRDGEQPLFLAVSESDKEVIKCLLKAGANANVTNFYDHTPIEVAAMEDKMTIVDMLFDATTPLPHIPDWTCRGIVDYVNTPEAKAQWETTSEPKFVVAIEKAAEAVHLKNYIVAVYWYTEALRKRPNDASVLSNRSLCWANLNDGNLALKDALECINLQPESPKAYYCAGVAWKILQEYEKAMEAFKKGMLLDPDDKGLEMAYKEVERFTAFMGRIYF